MVVISVAIALLGLKLVRGSVELRKLKPQHDVAGFLIAVVGVIYAVLLAFLVVIQWEQFSAARDDATLEANAIGSLYRDAAALGTNGRELAGAVRSYASEIVFKEWPYMAARQEQDSNVDPYLNAMWRAVRTLRAPPGTGPDFVTKAVTDVGTASTERRKRLDEDSSQLASPLWVVLIVGGVLTIAFTYFFGLESFAAQATMISALTVIIALAVFVILTLDLPFTGDVAIGPTSMRDEITEFCSYNFVNPQLGRDCPGRHG